MAESDIRYDCFLCGRPFRFGPHRYDGEYVRAWDIMICDICLNKNRDGIVPMTYPHLHEHLRSRGIATEVNVKGWIEIPRNLTRFTTPRGDD